MLRIAVQAKGRLYDETMSFLGESDIKLSAMKRSLLVQSSNFPLEVLFLRDDDIPQSVATGVADIGIVGENEFVEKNEDAEIIKRLGFSKCRLSLAMPKDIEYPGVKWFHGKKIATSYPGILSGFLKENGVNAEIHVITGSVEVAPGRCHFRYCKFRFYAGEQPPEGSRGCDEVRSATDWQQEHERGKARDIEGAVVPYGCREDSRR